MNPVNTTPYKLPDDAVWLSRALASLIASKPSHCLRAKTRSPADLSYLSEYNPNILKLALDVTSPESVAAAFASAAFHFNHRIDVVVNCAGYSLSGDTESATEGEGHREMETLFSRQGPRGFVIFNISSLAGLCAFPGHAYYHAGNFAVEWFSESVVREVKPGWNTDSLGTVNVRIVESSGVKTNFEGHSKARTKPHPAYAGPDMPARKLDAYVNMGIKSGAGMMEPSAVAKAIYKVTSRGERISLMLPLSAVAWKMAKAQFKSLLQEFEADKEVSGMGQQL
ncbi:hypothetical protein N657DRAFT_652986 [Parathielavia appendiculata]|uniref:NAD(P)-binding protein n=1 Tax=Parathielavia appendiculata TaxID=2587402 RepID=A0AAN6UAZ0_9PEZI|nr:hypothetical protein N657DRAFT_652986 [Parathielavia appendiculata]